MSADKNIWEGVYECDCGVEGILLSYGEDDYGKGKHPYVNMAYWREGHDSSYPMGLWRRIKHCWYVLKTGRIYSDMVLLGQREAGRLGRDLVEFSERREITSV